MVVDDTSAFVPSSRLAVRPEEFVEIRLEVTDGAPELHEDGPALLMPPARSVATFKPSRCAASDSFNAAL
jgi:hypothetical protein